MCERAATIPGRRPAMTARWHRFDALYSATVLSIACVGIGGGAMLCCLQTPPRRCTGLCSWFGPCSLGIAPTLLSEHVWVVMRGAVAVMTVGCTVLRDPSASYWCHRGGREGEGTLTPPPPACPSTLRTACVPTVRCGPFPTTSIDTHAQRSRRQGGGRPEPTKRISVAW